jgi:hypothetical protein
MVTYPIGNNNKLQEKHTIQHILQANKYNHNIPQHRKQNPNMQNPNENPPQKKRATFTYQRKETRTITKILRKAGLQIA